MGFLDRFRNAWNIFKNKDPTAGVDTGPGYYYRPDRMRFTGGNERSIITAVFNRIAMDVADIPILHVETDDDGRYLRTIDSPLNNVLSLEANIDQTGRAFMQDAVQSMLDEGCVALVPTIADDEPPDMPGGLDIYSVRTGRIIQWKPEYVKVDLYNERTGNKQEYEVPKASTCIVENPMYAVMNEPSSTMKRLARKLALLDVVDEKACSGRLDLIIQLPYVVKNEDKRKQAELRRKNLEEQLSEGAYGVAYTDATEHITQLNRPLENNLMKQIEYLTNLLFSQVGVTQEILSGEADEKTMLNYQTRIVEPIVAAFADEIRRKWLTKTARSRHQNIMYFRNSFKAITAENLAELADKLRRNSIATSNEIRQMIGWKPSQDPEAETLSNPNLSQPADQQGFEEGFDEGLYDEQQQRTEAAAHGAVNAPVFVFGNGGNLPPPTPNRANRRKKKKAQSVRAPDG